MPTSRESKPKFHNPFKFAQSSLSKSGLGCSGKGMLCAHKVFRIRVREQKVLEIRIFIGVFRLK
jgi:hypothetical protein